MKYKVQEWKKIHQPVLLREVLEFWNWRKGGFYIDATVGMGGHAAALLERDPNATCLALDRDADALGVAGERLSRFGERVKVLKDNYARLPEILKERGLPPADGILLDLGVSSLQLDRGERGFSFLRRGEIDMRMDRTTGQTALDMIHRLSADELARMIYIYGEEDLARPIALALKQAEARNELTDTVKCADVISKAVLAKKPWAAKGVHPATKTFQALRISVNNELENLGLFLKGASSSLSSGGKALVISFHSLEDRLVKNTMKEWAKGCVCPSDFPKCVCGKKPEFRILTKKAVRPTVDEVGENPRSRSARLRVAEKI